MIKSYEEPTKFMFAKGNPNQGRKTKIICEQTGDLFESIEEAARYIGCDGSLITMQLNGKRKHAKGFTFKKP